MSKALWQTPEESKHFFVRKQEANLVSTAMETGSIPLAELKHIAAKTSAQMRCFGLEHTSHKANYLALCAALASMHGHFFEWPEREMAWGYPLTTGRAYPLTRSEELEVRRLYEDAVSLRSIQQASFAAIRGRMLVYCIGLQELSLPAWCTTQIVIEATQPFGELARLHSVWSLVTRAKHWLDKKPST